MLWGKHPARQGETQIGAVLWSDDFPNLSSPQVGNLLDGAGLASIPCRCRFDVLWGAGVFLQSGRQTCAVFWSWRLPQPRRRYFRACLNRCTSLPFASICAVREGAERCASYGADQRDLSLKSLQFCQTLSDLDHRNGTDLNNLADDSGLVAAFVRCRRSVELPPSGASFPDIERLTVKAEQHIDIKIGERCPPYLAGANVRRYDWVSHVEVSSRLVRGAVSVFSAGGISLYTPEGHFAQRPYAALARGPAFRRRLKATIPSRR